MGHHGTKALVDSTYALYCGLVSTSVFSSSATPDTRNKRMVIRIGLKMVQKPPAAAASA